jgi:hypothetical protein
MEAKYSTIIDIAVLCVIDRKKWKHRAINKITLDLGLTLDDKEIVRGWLLSLKERKLVGTRTNQMGVDKWFITNNGMEYLKFEIKL